MLKLRLIRQFPFVHIAGNQVEEGSVRFCSAVVVIGEVVKENQQFKVISLGHETIDPFPDCFPGRQGALEAGVRST